jgi:hypothetical protein
MKITLEKKLPAEPQEYRIETVVKLPKDIKESYGVQEVGFSPNPFDPTIDYNVPAVEPNLQHLIDYIIVRER